MDLNVKGTAESLSLNLKRINIDRLSFMNCLKAFHSSEQKGVGKEVPDFGRSKSG